MIGMVLGELGFERSLACCGECKWIQVRWGGKILEAVDLVGCGKGDMVLLLSGDAARKIAMGCPGDWAAVAVLPGSGNNG